MTMQIEQLELKEPELKIIRFNMSIPQRNWELLLDNHYTDKEIIDELTWASKNRLNFLLEMVADNNEEEIIDEEMAGG